MGNVHSRTRFLIRNDDQLIRNGLDPKPWVGSHLFMAFEISAGIIPVELEHHGSFHCDVSKGQSGPKTTSLILGDIFCLKTTSMVLGDLFFRFLSSGVQGFFFWGGVSSLVPKRPLFMV